ncbi:CorA family divalent cation transporter [Streptomyces mirabilis]
MAPEIQAYFRDVADHLARVTEQITAFDALLDSILQAHLAQVTVAQNEDARKITAWAAIIAVPIMATGVYRSVREELRVRRRPSSTRLAGASSAGPVRLIRPRVAGSWR